MTILIPRQLTQLVGREKKEKICPVGLASKTRKLVANFGTQGATTHVQVDNLDSKAPWSCAMDLPSHLHLVWLRDLRTG